MKRHFVGYAAGMVLLLTSIVLVQGREPAFSPQNQEKTAKAAQQPDPQKQNKAAPKEEEERSPKTNNKAPVRVGDEEGDNGLARPAARGADLTQEAQHATNPVVRKLFEDLSPPHDLLTQPRGGTLKVETVPFFILEGEKIPENTKVKKLDAGKKSEPISLATINTKSLLGFEQVVLAKVNEFLSRDLDKKPAGDKEHLSRLAMLQEAEKALVAGILYHRSAQEQGKREEKLWGEAGKNLEQRLVDVQLQRLHIFVDAKDWSKGFELGSMLADSYSSKQGDRVDKRGVPVEVLNLLAKQSDDAGKDKRYTEVRHRLLQWQEQFPDSPQLAPFRQELHRHGNELLNQARELLSKDPNGARNKLIAVQEIDPHLAGLRDLTQQLNLENPILVVGVRSLPNHVSPAFAVTDTEHQSLELVFESLVRLAIRQPSGEERYEPGLSNDLPQVAPLGRWFQLRRDVFWDDGKPVRAGDVRATINHMADRRWPGHDVEWSKLMARSARIEDDAFQITLTMRHGYLDPLSLMDFKVLPESRGNGVASEDFARHPVGCGPFHFVGRAAGANNLDKCVFTANPFYGREGREGLPKIREIHMVKTENPARDFRDERLGMLLDPTTAKFKELQATPGLSDIVVSRTLRNRRIYFLALNHRSSIFQNQAFRQGLAHALKREEILNQCFREGSPTIHRALNGPYPPGSWACKPDVREYTPIFAKAQLELAKGTRAAKTTLTLKYPDDDPAVAKACGLIRDQIRELDLSLTIELMPRSPEQLHREVEVDHDYQLAYCSYDYPSETYWLWPLFQHDGDRENYLGYKNDGELETLLRKLMGHRNPTVVQDLAHQIHQHCFDKVPFVPLWQLDTHLVIRRNLLVPENLDPLAIFRDADRWVLEKN